MSVVRIRESRYYVFFLKKIYENFLGTLETVRNREESVLERCPYREVRLYSFLPLISCERFESRSHFKSRLSFFVRGNVVLSRTVVVDISRPSLK